MSVRDGLTGPVKGRRTKIIGTIGPASRAEDRLTALLAAGLDVVRLNMTHGTHEQHAAVIAAVRRWTQATDRSVAILLDLQGPKMRTGPLAGGGPVSLAARAPFTLTTRPVPGDTRAVATTYAHLPRDVTAGDTILLDDGRLELCVLATTATDVACRVVHGGVLDQHKGITLPGVAVSAPALTPKDEADLAFGLAHGVTPLMCAFRPTTDEQLVALQEALLSGGYASVSDTVVIIGSVPVMQRAHTNFLKLHRISAST